MSTELRIIDTSKAVWGRAKKTAIIQAKPLSAIINRFLAHYFLLDTLEGKELIDVDNVMCVGEYGDVWQQTAAALLKKYEVIHIDEVGWMRCQPRPDNEVQFYIATEDGYIQGHWGETVDGQQNMQWVNAGDSIVRQPHDHTDQWCVRKLLFKNTYQLI